MSYPEKKKAEVLLLHEIADMLKDDAWA
jgi:hypothetical protein